MNVWAIKLFAALLVVFATSMTGFSVARNYRERPRHLRQLQSALQGLSTEIGYGATPLPDAFAHLAATTRDPISTLFSVSAQVVSRPGATAAEAWAEGLEQLQTKSALFSSDIQILLQLGSVLGLSDKTDQERHLLLTAQQLQREEQKAEDDRQKNERMWKYLGVLSGILLVIVLV